VAVLRRGLAAVFERWARWALARVQVIYFC
jgi:hypothetical protein